MIKNRERLYVGSRRYVAALDAQTGEEIWRTKFASGTSAVVTMLLKGNRLFVGHSGHAYGLDAGTGAILWTNELPKMGFNPVMLAMEGASECASQAAVAAGAEAEAAAAAACVVT
ncbi:MAG TPA: PQQ-binding-like beta-propeller repeat protein [Phycisphaerae bacterium]|nr:PQQ-binding-like beta-propeller repeat protein [Phycisphaerae bacterium]